jgi:hypothetical protein
LDFGGGLKNWNWPAFPTDWSVANVIDHVFGFGLSVLAVAAIIKPRKEISV